MSRFILQISCLASSLRFFLGIAVYTSQHNRKYTFMGKISKKCIFSCLQNKRRLSYQRFENLLRCFEKFRKALNFFQATGWKFLFFFNLIFQKLLGKKFYVFIKTTLLTPDRWISKWILWKNFFINNSLPSCNTHLFR